MKEKPRNGVVCKSCFETIDITERIRNGATVISGNFADVDTLFEDESEENLRLERDAASSFIRRDINKTGEFSLTCPYSGCREIGVYRYSEVKELDDWRTERKNLEDRVSALEKKMNSKQFASMVAKQLEKRLLAKTEEESKRSRDDKPEYFK